MALNAAAHHSAEKVAAGEKNSGLRAQTSFSAGRPGVLQEPERQGGAVTDGYVAAPVTSLAVPLLAGAAGEVVDSSALRFLTAKALEAKRKEEQEEFQELDVLFRVPVDQLTLLQQRRLAEHRRSGAVEAWRAAVWENRRKMVVKKRKKKLPKTSSHLSRGRARRRNTAVLCFWLVLLAQCFSRCVPFVRRQPRDARLHGWYGWKGHYAVAAPVFVCSSGICWLVFLVALRAVFPVVYSGSGLCKVCFTGDHAPRSTFPSVVDRPEMLGIMAVMDQKNDIAFSFQQWHVQGYCWYFTPRDVSLPWLAGP